MVLYQGYHTARVTRHYCRPHLPYQEVYREKFPYLITEISARNPRSVRAHEKVGFKVVHSYQVTDPKPEEWIIVLWDWNS